MRRRSLRKKAGRDRVRLSSISKLNYTLKNELQPKLHGTAATGTDDRVGGGNVWRSAPAAEWASRWIIQSESILSAVGIGKVGMVENVKEFGSELSMEPFAKMPVLGN